ncbi:MAG: hypothetical protein SVN78_06365 [Deferribacterota bacterium]|nr:hypothetical protein [Deferribacterota bacterium]
MENKKLCSNILIILLFSFCCQNIYGKIVQGEGFAVIHDGGMKIAEMKAKEVALKDGIFNYLKEKTPNTYNIPEITEEFFKFLKSYKITSRYVKDYKVYYSIRADIIDFSIEDIYYLIDKIMTPVVYIINIKGDSEGFAEKDLYEAVGNKLKSANLDIKYEKDYLFALNDNREFDNVITEFANSKGYYLFIISLDSDINIIDNESYCRLELITNIYTRSHKFNTIKVIVTDINEFSDRAFFSALNKALDKMIGYVSENIIKIKDVNREIFSYNILLSDYKKYADVYNFLDFLKNMGVVNDYGIDKYLGNSINLFVKTIYKREDFLDKLKNYRDRFNYEIGWDDKIINIRFLF